MKKLICLILSFSVSLILAEYAMEKVTDYDYIGNVYYSTKNASFYECRNWCNNDKECKALSFNFISNPLVPNHETECRLFNETSALNPNAAPQRSINSYFLLKLQINSNQVCNRPWAFERVPNKMIRELDNALIYTSSKEACLSACLNENRFTCRSAEYNYQTLQCRLSESDRRTTNQYVEFVDAQGIDYFENQCLSSSQACKGIRKFISPRIGVPIDTVSQYVNVHYYVDKEVQAMNEAVCRAACERENEFLCRSYVYKGISTANQYNCQLYHLDHKTLPDGPSTYLRTERPLLDNGAKIGSYSENVCEKTISIHEGPATEGPHPVLFGTTTDVSGLTLNQSRDDGKNCDKTGTCYDVSVHCKDTRISVQINTSKMFNGRIYALGRSETCNIDVIDSESFRLDLTMSGQDCNTQSNGNGVYTNTVVLQHHSVVMTKADKIYKVKCSYDMSSRNITFGMMPVRDPETISVTSAPEAPAPRIRIMDARKREVETVRIGDRLTFRIEIPEDTPYGIFARSCVAMAKDSKSVFQIIDDDGCPIDSSIFPRFVSDERSALESSYEAFRFTESYGVIFQCNVKYCLGKCEPAVCDEGRESIRSWGRKRRSITVVENNSKSSDDDMTLSQEILVLDFGDEKQADFFKSAQSDFSAGGSGTNGADGNYGEKTVTIMEPCPTKSSIFALGATCILLFVLYISTLFCFYVKRLSTPKIVA